MTKAKVWWDPGVQAYRSSFPFKQQVVDFLKGNIPHSDRSFDNQTKVWTFTEQYFDGMVKFLQLAYGTSEVATVSKLQYEQAQNAARSNTNAVRKLDSKDADLAEFMHLLPYEAAREAYRKASFILHPDKGGDMEKMSKLNALWTRIQKEIYGQWKPEIH